MKKIKKAPNKYYPPLVLWAEDLLEIESYMREYAKEDGSIKITANEIYYDSVDEFLKGSKGQTAYEIDITAVQEDFNFNISLNLTKDWAHLEGSCNENFVTAIFFRIDEILARCQRKPTFIYHPVWGAFTIPLIISILSISLGIYYDYNPTSPTILLISFWLFYSMNLKCLCKIHPTYKHEKVNFFRRNFDQIILLVIGTALGVILSATAPKVIDKIWPPNGASNNPAALKKGGEK